MAEPWTPGPWFVSDDPREGMEWNRHIAIDPDGEKRICFMANGGPKRAEEFAANAKLIAASPELYKALKEAVLQIEYLHEKFQPTGSGNGVLAHCRAVLAKARGEQP